MPERFELQALFDVRGRTAVITGGSGYFGRAMAAALAQSGVRVAILGRHIETTQAAARSIQDEGGAAIGIACDVMKRADLERSREEIARLWAGRYPDQCRRRPLPQPNSASLTWT